MRASVVVEGIAVVPARIYLDIVRSQLEGDYTAVVAPLPVQLSVQAQVFSLRSRHTGHTMHWCIISPVHVEAALEQLVQASANTAIVFVFYSIRNILSSVDTALAWWMSPQFVARMGDTRFWCISQSLAQPCLYWAGGGGSPVAASSSSSASNSSNSEDDDAQFVAAQTVSLQQQHQQQRDKNWGRRLCRTRRCERALPNQALCVICNTNRASTAFLDCGHVSACEDCIVEDCEKGTGKMACYTCRTPCVLGPASLYVSETCTL